MQERVIGAFKQVVGFLTQGMEFDSGSWQAFETEMLHKMVVYFFSDTATRDARENAVTRQEGQFLPDVHRGQSRNLNWNILLLLDAFQPWPLGD